MESKSLRPVPPISSGGRALSHPLRIGVDLTKEQQGIVVLLGRRKNQVGVAHPTSHTENQLGAFLRVLEMA
eukprot:scaffold4703_cov108-Cylindrotheca_fusiformis.AAC.8